MWPLGRDREVHLDQTRDHVGSGSGEALDGCGHLAATARSTSDRLAAAGPSSMDDAPSRVAGARGRRVHVDHHG